MLALLRQTKGSLGTHSLRKFPSTWCSEHGCTEDHIEIRGRWKGKKRGRTVHRYISPEQLPVDAHLAAILAVGGPIRYKIKEDSHVTPEFMADTVCPSMTAFYTEESNHITDVLGPALLWAAHNPDLADLMSDQVRDRIKRGYAEIKGDHPADYNPVEKIPLLVFCVENQVHIEETSYNEMGGTVDTPLAANARTAGNAATAQQRHTTVAAASASRDHLRALQLQMNNLQNTVIGHQQQTNVSCSVLFLMLYIISIAGCI